MPLTYEGLAYRQTTTADSPWIITIVVAAEELLTWAGIPRRANSEEVMGFQRAVNLERQEKARDFFLQATNQSPTALIVGFRLAASDNPAILVELGPASPDSKAVYRTCRVTVEFEADQLSTDAIVNLVRAQIDHRLQGELPDDDEEELEASAAETQDEEGAAPPATTTDETFEDGDHDDIELGRSLLHRLKTRLEDAAWCEANREALVDLAKPATIIDGQHRVLGAALCERRLPFTVCALVDCTWAEQVFQFTVVNYTASRIPDQFITANAALSLTKDELDGLQPRLEQAGVKVLEYELMRVVNWDPESPFFELVDLAEQRRPDRIGYKTMVRVAKVWYAATHPAFRPLLANLYADLPGARNHSRRLQRWKEEDWGLFFIDFWREVRDHYQDKRSYDEAHSLWDVGHSNLTIAAVIFEFQMQFLLNLNAQDEDFFATSGTDPRTELRSKIRRRAAKFVDWFPPQFFARKWGMTSLNTGVGRRALQETLRRLLDSKGAYQYGQSALITGKTD